MVFTEHHNTEDTIESCLIECLSGSTIKNANLLENSSTITNDIVDEQLANLETEFRGSINIEVSEETIALLNNFKQEVIHYIYAYIILTYLSINIEFKLFTGIK